MPIVVTHSTSQKCLFLGFFLAEATPLQSSRPLSVGAMLHLCHPAACGFAKKLARPHFWGLSPWTLFRREMLGLETRRNIARRRIERYTVHEGDAALLLYGKRRMT